MNHPFSLQSVEGLLEEYILHISSHECCYIRQILLIITYLYQFQILVMIILYYINYEGTIMSSDERYIT